MRLYTIHERPSQAGSSATEAPDFELVKDGFCWPALFLPLLWGLWRGQWTGLLAYMLCIMAISTLTVMAEPGRATELALGLGLALLVGFSANDWRRWRLRRLGYRQLGAVAAANLAAAELRVLSALQDGSLGGGGAESGTDLPAQRSQPGRALPEAGGPAPATGS